MSQLDTWDYAITFSSRDSINIIYYLVVLEHLVYTLLECIWKNCLCLVDVVRLVSLDKNETSRVTHSLHSRTDGTFCEACFFSLIFPLFLRRREARICHYSEYCIMSRLRNRDSMSFIFCVLFFILSIANLPVLFYFYQESIVNIFAIISLNYLAFQQQ